MRLVSMPTTRAASAFWLVARIAVPSRLRVRKAGAGSPSTATVPMMTKCWTVKLSEPSRTMVSAVGTRICSALGPHSATTPFWITRIRPSDATICIWMLSRSGRNTACSSTIPSAASAIIDSAIEAG